MKKFLIPVLFIASFSLQAATALSTYQDVMNHFDAGESLKLQVKLDQCDGASALSSGILFTVNVDPAMNLRSTLKFSTTHFTRNNPKHRGESIYEYTVFQLSDDNKLRITTQTDDPNSYQALDSEMTFNCEMGKAAVFYASN